jgi:hypothetical protein
VYASIKVAGIALSKSSLKAVSSPATKICSATWFNILVAYPPRNFFQSFLSSIAMSRLLKAVILTISALYLFLWVLLLQVAAGLLCCLLL